MDIVKDKKIKNEIEMFEEIFKNIEEDKKPFAEKLYTQAAFMLVTLEELQEDIKTNGAITEAANGNGFVVRGENPAQKSYNTMIKNYNATIKALTDLIPEGKKEGADELMEFIKNK